MDRLDGPVALFVPCYVEQFYPKVAIATLELLEKLGCDVVYPQAQTCCGQPFANSGYQANAKPLHDSFVKNFSNYPYIVSPSGSCTLYANEHIVGEQKTYELVEFLYDILQVKTFNVTFPYRVGVHQSCHGLRGLGLAKPSELNIPDFNKTNSLLEKVKDIDIVSLNHPDECCGFGGTFAILEEEISVKMGNDRIKDHQQHNVDVITGNDMSCLMHLEGLLKRSKSPIRVCHVAEILNGSFS